MITINKEKQKDLKKFEKVSASDEIKKFKIPKDILISMENILNIIREFYFVIICYNLS